MKNITVKNISSSDVVLIAPNVNYRRDLAPGRVLPLEKNIFEELTFDSGFQSMVRCGFLRVDGEQEVKEAIVVDNEDKILSYEEVKEIYANKDFTTFAKTIVNAPQATKDNFVKAAIDMNVVDNGFTALIKKYCGVDVFEALNIKHQTV